MPVQALQGYVSSFASHRLVLYSTISVAAVAAVVANALKSQSNFYSTAIHLAKSNGSVVVLANFCILCAVLFGRVLQQIFFGQLRTMEVERLYDRMWFFVTESLLAFTIFRDEFDVPFAMMFGMLLFTKCFHWLLSDRIEWMDQRPYPGPPLLFHLRTNALMGLLWASDTIIFLLIVENLLTNGFSGIVLFANEYAILLASLLNSAAKYGIAIVDLRRASRRGGENAPPWEDKSMYTFYVELATDFLKLVTYMTFFLIVLTFYGLPLNIIRDVYITARSFIVRFRDLLRYRTATRNMDERYPNATEEELSSMNDNTCIICREEMSSPASTSNTTSANSNGEPRAASSRDGSQHEPASSNATSTPATTQDGPNTTPKRLPCGHVFHFYCLRSWLERQQSCPTCRRSVLETNQQMANGAARPPAPPQPGAVPQAQNVRQQQQPRRLLNRFWDIARMPPIVPGQFADGPQPAAVQQPQQQQPQNMQRYGGDGDIHPTPPPIVANGHAPPERLQGFWGPGGWHAWPADPRPPAQNPGQGTSRGTPTTPTPAVASSASSSPLAPASSTGASSNTLDENADSADNDSSSASSALTPREAAAQAALKRLGSGRSFVNRRSNSTAGPSSEVDSFTANTTASTSASTLTPTEPAQPAGSSTPPLAPSLIPLYDTASPTTADVNAATVRLTETLQRLRQLNHLPPRPTSTTQGASTGAGSSNASAQAPSSSSFSFNFSNSSPFAAGQGRGASRSLRDLPPTLTEEQLATMDTLTREAIDERLRLLENVHSTTARCIDELLRARSVFPLRATTSSSTTTAAPAATDVQEERQQSQAEDASSLRDDTPALQTGATAVNTSHEASVQE